MLPRARELSVTVAAGYLLVGVIAYATALPARESGGLLPDPDGGRALLALWLASGTFAVLTWRLSRPQGVPEDIWPAATWALAAVVAPLALYPVAAIPRPEAALVVATLWPLSCLPLGIAIARLASERRARLAAVASLAAGLAVGLGLFPLAIESTAEIWLMLRVVAVAAVAGAPGLALLAGSGRWGAGGRGTVATQVVTRAAFVVVFLAPAFAGTILLFPWGQAVALMTVSVGGVVLAGRMAVRPLAWIATRANAQRDLAVAVSEAERTRLAADLHDGPLQGILLLGRRLETAGDPEGAALARDIGRDLRDLSADLRLPMLDDLGVGPALEWLAARVRRLTGLDISVRYDTDGRAPPDVELAAFRIAQEAISNAVRHGQPPIAVRCRTTGATLSLSVEDAGAGIGRGVSADTGSLPRFGLLNMQQRAEQVGARLDLRSPRAGGTHVAVEWQAAP